MLNPKHLASLLAIAEHGTFAAAGGAIGRSHSAVSLHIKALEEELGCSLIDRTARPVELTPDGAALAEQARRLSRVLDDIRMIGRSDQLAGSLSVGVVPSAMAHVAPPALADLTRTHPGLRLSIRTGLSGELAQAIRSSTLDAAVLTGPDLTPEDLDLHLVAEEPLVVIAPADAAGADDTALVTSHPFIWFNRTTWAGQQIERRLLDRGIATQTAMEVDSLEAIEALVRHGLGVSVVPDHWGGAPPGGLRMIPFCRPQASRRLVLATRPRSPRQRPIDALRDALRKVAMTRCAGETES